MYLTGVQEVEMSRQAQRGAAYHQVETSATSDLMEAVVYEQVTSLRSITFGLVDDLLSQSNGASLSATVALTHLQDIANKLGVVESLLTPRRAGGEIAAA